MIRTILKSKIHRATVTDANLEYEGSITIDLSLMKAADILPFEQVHVVDINNGARLVTYAIPGETDSGIVCINGAAAHLIEKNDVIIIMAYALIEDDGAGSFYPTVVNVDRKNAIVSVTDKSASEGEC